MAELQLHPGPLQVGSGGGRERRGHGGQHPLHQVDQDNPAITLTELLEIALDGPVHQLDQGPGQLATGGACSHHHHGLQERPLLGVGGLFGFLEGHQQPPANLIGVLEDLHGRC